MWADSPFVARNACGICGFTLRLQGAFWNPNLCKRDSKCWNPCHAVYLFITLLSGQTSTEPCSRKQCLARFILRWLKQQQSTQWAAAVSVLSHKHATSNEKEQCKGLERNERTISTRKTPWHCGQKENSNPTTLDLKKGGKGNTIFNKNKFLYQWPLIMDKMIHCTDSNVILC